MTPALRLVALIAAAAVGLGACGGSDTSTDPASQGNDFNRPFTNVDAYPSVVSSELVVGSNRVLIGMFDKNDAPVGTPASKMHVAFYDLAQSSSKPVSQQNADFVWAIKGVRGLWAARDVEFDEAGKWGVKVSVHGGGIDEDDLGVQFEVRETGTTPAVGSPAPASDTPTSADVTKLSEITSDRHPDPRFYKTSIADALRKHEPFVVVFATPKYCTSRVCGPTLDVVKGVAPDYPRITFIHVEVYDLSDVSNLKPVPAVAQWGLPGEPWVFVVDSKGDVAAKYEGVVAPSELRAELDHLR